MSRDGRWKWSGAGLAALAAATLAGPAPQAESQVLSMATTAAGTGSLDSGSLKSAPPSPASRGEVRSSPSHGELAWEVNRGQWPASVRFAARAKSYTAFATDRELVMNLPYDRDEASDTIRFAALRMVCEGASESVTTTGAAPLPGVVNYLKGNDPAAWVTAVATYGSVRRNGTWDGVDMVLGSRDGAVEYAFEIAPGARVDDIALRFEGASALALDRTGSLVLRTPGGVVSHGAPVAFQMVRGERRSVGASFLLNTDGTVGFTVGSYDAALPLVIDPLIDYSTYFGGGDVEEHFAVDVGNSGESWFVGYTESVNFPVSGGAFSTSISGLRDATVTKLNTAGAKVFATYLGGDDGDYAEGVDADLSGRVFVAGRTVSTDFPTSASGFATTDPSAGVEDAFLAVLNASGTSLVYGSYLGGSADPTRAFDISIDQGGLAAICGFTQAADFPDTDGTTLTGTQDSFIALFDTNASGAASLLDASFFGGAGVGTAFGVNLDSANGLIHFCGETDVVITESASIITGSSYGGGTFDAYAGTYDFSFGTDAIVYADLLGGDSASDADHAYDIARLGDVVYITGGTRSPSFTTASSLFTHRGSEDIFVMAINTGTASLVYSTLYGGSEPDFGRGVSVDYDGNVFVTGATGSDQTVAFLPFPLVSAVDSTLVNGDFDAFVLKIDSTLSVDYATYLGGTAIDAGESVASDLSGNAVVVGTTVSSDFPTANAISATLTGPKDGFVSRLVTSTMNIVPTRGHYTDTLSAGKDKFKIQGSYSFNSLSPNPTFDPTTDDLDIVVSNSMQSHAVTIVANDPRWKLKGTKWKFSGTAGGGKWVVEMDTTNNKFTFTKTGFTFTGGIPLETDPIRVNIDLTSGGGNNDGVTGRFFYEGAFNTLKNETVLRYDGK